MHPQGRPWSYFKELSRCETLEPAATVAIHAPCNSSRAWWTLCAWLGLWGTAMHVHYVGSAALNCDGIHE